MKIFKVTIILLLVIPVSGCIENPAGFGDITAKWFFFIDVSSIYVTSSTGTSIPGIDYDIFRFEGNREKGEIFYGNEIIGKFQVDRDNNVEMEFVDIFELGDIEDDIIKFSGLFINHNELEGKFSYTLNEEKYTGTWTAYR